MSARRADPKQLFIVTGEPRISFTGNSNEGPLIYHFKRENTEDIDEETTRIAIPGSISNKQVMSIEYLPTLEPTPSMARLSFSFFASRPVRRLLVYTDVEVHYKLGVGVILSARSVNVRDGERRIESSDLAANDSCILNVAFPLSGEYTTNPFPISQLHPHTFHSSNNGRLASAPIAIVVGMEIPNKNSSPLPQVSNLQFSQTTKTKDFWAFSELTDDFDCVLYTFLPLPPASNDHAVPASLQNSPRGDSGELDSFSPESGRTTQASFSLPENLSDSVNPFKSPKMNPASSYASWPKPVLKQVLQVYHEAYELVDVYEVGAYDEKTEMGEGELPAEDEDEFEENGNLCAICLCEEKNTTLLPCRHSCCCEGCARKLREMNNMCPICRNAIEKILVL